MLAIFIFVSWSKTWVKIIDNKKKHYIDYNFSTNLECFLMGAAGK